MTRSQAPLFNLRGFFMAAFGAFLICWPIWLTGDAYIFADTKNYYHAGAEIWKILESLFPAASSVETLGAGSQDIAVGTLAFDGKPRFGRSLVYPALFYPIVTWLGPLGLAWAHGTLVLFALFALITPNMLHKRWVLVVGFLVLAVFTSLPWRTVYMMPDIFAAVVIIFGALLVGPFDRLTSGQQIVLTLLAAFAVATHYGNVPFAAAFLGLVLLWRLFEKRFALVPFIAGIFVAVSSPLFNLGASSAVLDAPSATPLRLPILLARSIQDGPGSEYLRENCDTEDWAICEAFEGRIPSSIREFLWSDDGINAQTPEMVQRIRQEELALVGYIFLAYPAQQSWSLSRNALRQLVRFGQGDINSTSDFEAYLAGAEIPELSDGGLHTDFKDVVEISAIIGAFGLLSMLFFARQEQRRLIFAVVLGLACNAIVFGGLSAPVDRYQARVIWLVPALVFLILAEIGARRRNGLSLQQAGSA
ncbi:MAG: hypothetical protein AAGA12_08515 [Pseudomonadota bacterium]